MSTTADRPMPNMQPNTSNSQDSQDAQKHPEGALTRQIEDQTAKIPSDVFLMAALGSIAVAFALEVAGSKEKSRFVGQWVSPFLLLGVYNKLVKVAGSDRVHPS
ncbi:MAG: hypothetical protein ACR2MQ_10205 [Gemmatimonadaceae bacterium]